MSDFLSFVSPATAPDDADTRAAHACLERFTAAFNAADFAGMDTELHFPHSLLSGAERQEWTQPGQHPAGFFDALRATGWAHTRYESIHPVLSGPDKVHFVLVYTRRNASHQVLSTHHNLWIVTRQHGRWGIALRSY